MKNKNVISLHNEAKRLKKAHPKLKNGGKRRDTLLTLFLLILLGIVGYFIFYKPLNNLVESLPPTPTEQVIPTAIQIPTITQKNIKIINPIPTINSDPVINCSLNEKCGGGTIRVRSSECSNTTCCEIADKWVLYKDRNQCKKDQETYWNNYYGSGNNYVAPTYAPIPIPTYSSPVYSTPAYIPHPTSYPTPTPNYTALLQDCISQANDEYNSTMSILRGQGMADSSSAVVAEQKRNSKLQQCQNLYGN